MKGEEGMGMNEKDTDEMGWSCMEVFVIGQAVSGGVEKARVSGTQTYEMGACVLCC